jgi:hypothetical protein
VPFRQQGSLNPSPFLFGSVGEGAKWRTAAHTGRKDRKIRRRGFIDVGNQTSFCPDPRWLAQSFRVGQSYANT